MSGEQTRPQADSAGDLEELGDVVRGDRPRTLRGDPEDVRRTISETADPIRLKTQLKRGDGTRDQDVIEVKVRGDDPEQAVGMLNDTLELLRETADTVRAIQPDSGGDEGDD